jgi:hypothetical protein
MLQDLLAQFGVFFAFPTKALNIHNSSINVTFEMGVHLGVIGLHPLHSPPFLKMCFTPKQFSWLHGPLPYTFNCEPNVKVGTFQHMCPLIRFHTLNWKEFDNLKKLTFEKMEVFLHGYRWVENMSKSFIK